MTPIDTLRKRISKATGNDKKSSLYQDLLKHAKVSIEDFLNFAIFLRETNQYNTSLAILDQTEDKFGVNPWVEDNRGRALLMLHRDSDAINAWEIALSLATSNEQKSFFLQCIESAYKQENIELGKKIAKLKKTGSSEAIISMLYLYLSNNKNNLFAYLELCIAYRENNEFEDALNILNQAKEKGLHSIWMYDNYARIYYDQKLYKKAAFCCEKALAEVDHENDKINFIKLLERIKKGPAEMQLNALLSTQHGFEKPDTGSFYIDAAIQINNGSILIFGWMDINKDTLKAIYFYQTPSEKYEITNSLFKLSRKDIYDSLKDKSDNIVEFCGFVCCIPQSIKAQSCFLEFNFNDHADEWVAIPLQKSARKGINQIKELLKLIPCADRMKPDLFELFDSQLGQAIDCIASTSTKSNNIDDDSIKIIQFGQPYSKPGLSIIIPLFGRYDFLRYQLACFANDPDFKNIDIIYVIDDPKIIIDATEFATIYSPVFGLPFRLISYATNLGFSGANNIGVRFAMSNVILLMNSDVIPKAAGWTSILKNALNSRSSAGAVGPLLQFYDDSIQHAGMFSKRDLRLPGFLLNIHKDKGLPWEGGNQSFQAPMLTAACLMLKKQDYLNVGGLDEGYILGDFEDSDLCLALRKKGKSLWLIPEARLWHLERQSQILDNISSYRFLLTLYNGWRLKKKIEKELIANPEL